jgi:hypothetical protein
MYRLFIVLFLLYSCSAEKHLMKAEKHIAIAKSKGAVIKSDTVWKYSYTSDTIYNKETNTLEVRHLVKDSFPYTVTNTIKSSMSKQERKYFEDMFKHMEKMMKLQNDSLRLALKFQTKQHKQDKKTERTVVRQENKSNPWVWVILAALLVLAIFLFKFQ